MPCTLVRVDPRSNRVAGESIELTEPWDLVVGAGSVWVTQFDGALARVDERTGEVQAILRPPAGSFGTALAFGGGSIWIASYPAPDQRASLARIDPQSGRIDGAVDDRVIDARTQSLVFGNGAVWLVDHDHFLVKIDPRTLDVRAREPVGFVAIGIAATEGGVHLADPHGRRLVLAEAGNGHIRRTTTMNVAPIYPAMGGGYLWVIDEHAWAGTTEDDRILRIHPRTHLVLQTLHVGANPAAISYGHGSTWVALRSGELIRLTD